MKERPLLFSAPMVLATLDGSKTQTRRIFNPRRWTAARLNLLRFVHVLFGEATKILSCAQPADTAYAGFDIFPYAHSPSYFKCPYGQPGDRLWVRETHCPNWCDKTIYKADGGSAIEAGYPKEPKWRPSIHMRREYSRILLEITDVRIERLQDISEADAMAEGISEVNFRPCDGFPLSLGYMVGKDDGKTSLATSAIAAYRELWEAINGASSWDKNPWVWVIEFKKIAP